MQYQEIQERALNEATRPSTMFLGTVVILLILCVCCFIMGWLFINSWRNGGIVSLICGGLSVLLVIIFAFLAWKAHSTGN